MDIEQDKIGDPSTVVLHARLLFVDGPRYGRVTQVHFDGTVTAEFEWPDGSPILIRTAVEHFRRRAVPPEVGHYCYDHASWRCQSGVGPCQRETLFTEVMNAWNETIGATAHG